MFEGGTRIEFLERLRTPAIAPMLACIIACGANTGLEVGEPRDAGGVPTDGGPSRRDGQVPEDADTDDVGDVGPRDSSLPVEPPVVPPNPTCIEVPADGPLRLSARVRAEAADVLFLIDRTDSMAFEIEEIREEIAVTLIPRLESFVRSLAVGIVAFDEVRGRPYGGDLYFRTFAALSTDLSRASRAVLEIETGGGTSADPPEAAVPVLHDLFEDFADCVDVNGLCLRDGVQTLVLLFTDAPLHNGPGGAFPYGPVNPDPPDAGVPVPRPDAGPLPPVPLPPATYGQMLAALRPRGVRVLGLYSGSPRPGDAIDHLRQLASDTGALNTDGTPIFFDIGASGQQLGEGVATVVGNAMRSSASVAEVFGHLEDLEGDGQDPTAWVTEIMPLQVVPANGARIDGSVFRDVTPSAVITFELPIVVPPGVPPGAYPMNFVVMDGEGNEHGRYRIRVVVPGPGIRCE